ncbi:sulfite exporter TauE/SafE family protein [Trueperella sp. LYQ143]|uniref:sulfite exporter TauE/SafE family protein n=1 Tax=unclassified Trueperella TaxID=2630174 RepID=UPI00398370E1
MEWVIALGAGLGIGLIVGILGAGGGILSIPALVYLLHHTPHNAAAESLIIVSLSACAALFSHAKHRCVHWRDGCTFAAVSSVSAIAGARLAPLCNPTALMFAFAGVVFCAGCYMLWRWRRESGGSALSTHDVPAHNARPSNTLAHYVPATSPEVDQGAVTSAAIPYSDSEYSDEDPSQVPAVIPSHYPPVSSPDSTSLPSDSTYLPSSTPPPSVHLPPAPTSAPAPRWWAMATAGASVGLLCGVFGVGGGFAVVPVLVAIFGFPMLEATGTSVLVMFLTSAAGLVGRIGTPVHIIWHIVILFGAASLIGSALGAPLSRRAKNTTLSLGFALLLFGVAVMTIILSFFTA